MPARIKNALAETYEDVLRNHTLQMAAGALVLLRSLALSIPHLFFIGHRGILARSQSFRRGSEHDGAVLTSGQHGVGPQSFV